MMKTLNSNTIRVSMLFRLLMVGLVAPNSSFSQSNETGSTPSQRTIEVESTKMGKFDSEDIDESSGLIASQNHPDKFWTHNDNGDDLRLFLIDAAGTLHGVVQLTNVKAQDIEDIAGYEFEGRSQIVLGDIGDNAFRRKNCELLVFEEPELQLNKEKVARKKIDKITRIKFAYEDGSRNCEAMAIDSQRHEVWLATKESLAGPLSPKKREPAFYRLSIADMTEQREEPLTARKIAPLRDPLATGMDFSHNGSLVVIRTYTYARLYRRASEQTWDEVFRSGESEMFGLPTQIQGEAICFFQDDAALLTTSEQKGQPIWRLQLPADDSK